MTLSTTPTSELVSRAARALVARGSQLDGTVVIPGNDPHPAPQQLYATVLLYNSVTRGLYQTIEGQDADEVQVYVGSTFSVQWYRSGAVEAGTRFRMWCETPDAADEMVQHGFLYVRCGALRRLDAVISSNYEERAALDLELLHVQRQTTDRVPIEGVDLRVDANDVSEEANIDGS